MKKLFYILSVIVTLASCSNDEKSSENETSSILIKRIVHTYSKDDITTLNYLYDGNKIISEKDENGFLRKFTYTENLITKIEETVKNQFQNSKDYSYKNEKLDKVIIKQNYGGTITFTYSYNNDNTISYVKTQTGSENNTGVLTIVNGNVIKNKVIYGGKYPSTINYVFEYDTKNNPFKNVLGFDLLLDDEEMFSANNMTKDGSGEPPFNFTLKYDANDFPIEKKTTNNGSNEIVQYFY
ncbi:MAG: hypothetical protein ABI554_09665 [Flavobacterium sp.]